MVTVARPVHRVIVLISMTRPLAIDELTIERSTFQSADSDLLHPEGWQHLTRSQTSTTRFAL